MLAQVSLTVTDEPWNVVTVPAAQWPKVREDARQMMAAVRTLIDMQVTETARACT